MTRQLLNTYVTKNAPELKRAPNDMTGKKLNLNMSLEPATKAELKALGNVPDGYIAGWASTNSVDSYGHIVQTGAFLSSIQTRGFTGPKSIKLLIGHDWNKVGGVIRKLEYKGNRLWIEAQLELDIGYVADSYKAAKLLGGLNFSVGFFIKDYSFKDVEGRDVLEITEGDLFEVSVVPFPGNEDCTMEFIKNAPESAPTTLAEFEKALVAKGLAKGRNDAHNITQEVKSALHLFLKDRSPAPEVENDSVIKKSPLLDSNKINELMLSVSKMKQILAPEA